VITPGARSAFNGKVDQPATGARPPIFLAVIRWTSYSAGHASLGRQRPGARRNRRIPPAPGRSRSVREHPPDPQDLPQRVPQARPAGRRCRRGGEAADGQGTAGAGAHRRLARGRGGGQDPYPQHPPRSRRSGLPELDAGPRGHRQRLRRVPRRAGAGGPPGARPRLPPDPGRHRAAAARAHGQAADPRERHDRPAHRRRRRRHRRHRPRRPRDSRPEAQRAAPRRRGGARRDRRRVVSAHRVHGAHPHPLARGPRVADRRARGQRPRLPLDPDQARPAPGRRPVGQARHQPGRRSHPARLAPRPGQPAARHPAAPRRAARRRARRDPGHRPGVTPPARS
jgi:hypothetical protein